MQDRPRPADPKPWDADVVLSAEGAARRIETLVPGLAPARLERIGTGWDNDAYLVNGEWVFRFPRRELGARTMAREIEFLPPLVPHLPLAVPRHEHVGAPDAEYPYPFAGYRQLPGRTACSVVLPEAPPGQ